MAVKTPARVAFQPAVDYRDEIKARADRVRLLVIPMRRYLMIDGTDVPGGPAFRNAIGSLYPVAYTLHFALKRRGVAAPVGALEGLFWEHEPGPIDPAAFGSVPAGAVPWSWRLLLPVPRDALESEIVAAFESLARKPQPPPALEQVRCETWEEGPVAQILHVGSYAAEPPTIARLHDEIRALGLRPVGCHHEIYVSDPGRTKPERLKTLVRQPVAGPGAGRP
jgi:hypothetical protein